ncbi:MAG: hypothetical protein KatS3mg127_0445 [Silanimonas sp.]|nr:MAG: hypothetical protein KatS3mg127_0445 [Silanimonas sp.]
MSAVFKTPVRRAWLERAVAAAILLSTATAFAADPAPKPKPWPKPPVLEVIESGSPEARRRGETVERLPDPFELPPIPVIESGSREARAMGEHFSNPEALRRREAAWARDSTFPPNPDTVPGRYRFDLRLRQLVDSADGLVDMTCFANSRDASLLCPEWGLGGWTLGMASAQGRFEFVLRQADGDVLVCGQHRDLGPACVQMGDEIGPAFAWLRNMGLNQAFLDSIATTPQTLGDGPRGAVQGVRGRTADGFLQLWFDPRGSGIATRMPWIGMGVGLLRDERARVVRTVRGARFEGADRDGGDVILELIELAPARIERDLAGYRLITAFTARGLEESMSLSAQLMALQREGMGIRAELDACPKSSAGRDCRAHHRERLKALEQRARDMALGFGRRHGLPVDD